MMEQFLEKNETNLINSLRQKILSDASTALTLIEELQENPRYINDEIFATILKIERISALSFLGKHKQYIEEINDVYQTVLTLNNNAVYIEACSRLGVAYAEIGATEKAIELLHKVHKRESKLHTLSDYSAIAYANLGALYYQYGKKDEHYFYYKQSIAILDDIIDFNKPNSRQISTYAAINANLAMYAFDNNDIKNYNQYLENINTAIKANPHPANILLYKETQLFQHLYKNDEEQFIASVREVLQLFHQKKDFSRAVTVLNNLFEFNPCIDIPKDKLIPICCDMLDTVGENAVLTELKQLYLIIINYAIENHDKNLMLKFYQKLEKINASITAEDNIQKSQALDFLIEHAEQEQKHKQLIKKNQYLHNLIEEKEVQSKELTKVYNKLRIISSIGRKITAKSSLQNICKTLHQEFSAFMTIDTIAIFTQENNKSTYLSAYIYDRGEIYDDICVNVESSTSICCQILKSGEAIISNDIPNDNFFNELEIIEGKLDISKNNNSAIYYPISQNKIVIAILTIQAINKNVYSQEHIDIINAIEPYISIAIINYLRSERLQQELLTLKEYKKKYN